ncbi:MAG: hypothetical protein HEQ20_05515 [Aphanizomenon flos-aquae KM1D3_PB]|uniref:hypothetical protein n=1 Tax=Aphanizomenon flos-aquae TaxID=1176 RepID=UPI001363EDBA|nr:hypothetical protein [Aphanizomenon flos-aquae]QSV70322.1 MAG: hypothetical protein HEQ20_05515 [Aphanizomenon flos-aquae KM1D3_PB]
MSLGQGNREHFDKLSASQGTGNRERVLGDFTFLHIPLNFSVHLLTLQKGNDVNFSKC